MHKNFFQIFKIIPVITIFALLSMPVFAASYDSVEQATKACGSRSVVTDFSCQRQKLLNPSVQCGLYICEGESEFGDSGSDAINLNFFGVRINARESNLVQVLMFVLFNVFLGVVAIAIVFYGVWGAFIRAYAESDEELTKANKTLVNVLVGLFIIASSFVLAQLIASFLGLGSINELVDFNFSLGD